MFGVFSPNSGIFIKLKTWPLLWFSPLFEYLTTFWKLDDYLVISPLSDHNLVTMQQFGHLVAVKIFCNFYLNCRWLFGYLFTIRKLDHYFLTFEILPVPGFLSVVIFIGSYLGIWPLFGYLATIRRGSHDLSTWTI